MRVLLLLCALQAPAPGTPAADEATAQAPQVAPYPGPLDEGLAELARVSDAGQHERALELGDALQASPLVAALSEARRARLLHDIGLARARGGRVDQAVVDLRAAAALAGPGALRATSLFEAGTVRLVRAEELRLEVPEIAQRLGVPVPPAPPIPPGASDAPDFLALAREAYLGARAELLERLRLDWRDEDTRANLELVARRLRELDEVERQREEQQQQQQQQQQQADQQDQQQPDQGQQDQGQDQPPEQQQPPPEDAQGEEQPGDEQTEQPPPEPEPGEEQQQAQPEPAREEERVLTREEVQRLLDQLQEIEEQARAVRALLRERRRTPVEKDW